jgi:hypothetical protein
MSDAAFKSAPYPGHTSSELRAFIAKAHGDAAALGVDMSERISKMNDELNRRVKVASGDRSVMTDGERLQWARVQGGIMVA